MLVVALTVAAVVFGVMALVSGRDPGLTPTEPDGRAVPLPTARPLRESDVGAVRFDTALRGYRMTQVDQALRRAAYDIGYKSELIGVLEAEVAALREGRVADADALRGAREQAGRAGTVEPSPSTQGMLPVDADRPDTAGQSGATTETATGLTVDATDTGSTGGAGRDRAGDATDTGSTGGDGSVRPAGDVNGPGPVVGSESR